MKLKYFYVILLMMGLSVQLFAQDKKAEKPKYGWQKEAVGLLNFTQNSFDNWSKGGENSWAWQLNFNAKANLEQEKYSWNNSAKISYGMTKVGDLSARKAADEIKLETVYTYKMSLYVNPYVAATGLTQFTDGYAYTDTSKTVISHLLDPGYFTQSAGVGIQPFKILKTRLGAALKETVADEFSDTYAKGEKFRVEYGAESVTDVNWQMTETILFTSKLEMFSNLKALDQIDVNWDNLISAKIAKYLSVSFNVKIFYDRDISPVRQLKQTLAVGLSYSFL